MSTVNLKFRSFESSITYFNVMYSLPISRVPSIAPSVEWQKQNPTVGKVYTGSTDALHDRLESFRAILMEELAEVDEIMEKLRKSEYKTELEFLTDMADWLGDIQVYCASEMVRFGIPINDTLNIIMQSNFSKLDADGKPIISGGKVQKGPFYWKPEPKIQELLEKLVNEF